MKLHGNARSRLNSRRLLCERIEAGSSVTETAAAAGARKARRDLRLAGGLLMFDHFTTPGGRRNGVRIAVRGETEVAVEGLSD